MTSTPRPAIEIDNLSKRFGKTNALDGLSLNVPQGAVYALLGRNGAGKSTLIQLLMGMLEPTGGSLSVLGLDPLKEPIQVRTKTGYIPERLPMYDWMTVDEILRFVAAAFPNWRADDERQLVETFHLDRKTKVGALSRGYRALLSLVMAMSHDPELVLLDECTSGMDAIARREFERCVIDALSESGRTVLFASHQIDELERLCDWVGIIHQGRMLIEAPLETLKASVRAIRITGADDIPSEAGGWSVIARKGFGRDTLLTVRAGESAGVDAPPLEKAGLGTVVEEVSLSLEEIFIALVESAEARR